ncbi:DeoR/GlpR family DNA-binding transcription regulator [Paenibacillus sp. BJ-4]|uniref:DeoR/GlpR family DNA-binding transcription regulator n=1 Tax=Paenibacillus sp. BJ-4 TaxID=2878097 RepID=UPI001CF015C3|nr:DeoR/GlpR family DNA-binding transcription regulator [Paenibacillus sp. BJ-4]
MEVILIYQEERLVKILERLHKEKMISNQEICDMLGISRDTVRRDFIRLVDEGAAIRTHGGIALPQFKDKIKAYKERINASSEDKYKIGKIAASYISKGDLCFLDVSTTVKFLCDHLNTSSTVYTHSLDNAEALSNNNEVDVYLLGGKFNHENRFFFDVHVASQLNDIYFDKVFLGAAGILKDGIYFSNYEDAVIKGIVAERSKEVILLADSQKFNQISSYKGVDLIDIDMIITNENPPDEFRKSFEENNIKIRLIHEGKTVKDYFEGV